MSCQAITGCVQEGAPGFNRARYEAEDGTALVQADITSIARKVFDLDGTAPDTPVDTSTPAVGTVIFDTLQTPSSWKEDATGYNFKDTVAATVLADGGRRYRVEYTFTLAAGGTFRPEPFELTTRDWRGD